mmetsp:Transcript_22055/g.56415  ORF Transcript_22055/g.56415 Transcript_22055/m.56415 type:complete len:252 (-) Transcript_22055:77-832(-)|eukprot:CAMPEP_0183444570 /NCGR_PEP_ID=MMETSP0370-20130417/95512_1 /TAXON_ID=268820 /ORGANISM="Peridinium aciculiferum, Strain PAER-2" /LENGTH=251 /DNA_ID=CAMNT_0025634977 /DNA_START=83 /DNA_END=838 /DNA_ORIENTATION=+
MAGIVVALCPKRLCCFQKLGEFGCEAFEERRHQVLRICEVLSFTGLALAVCGFTGAFTKGDIGKVLAWVKYGGKSKPDGGADDSTKVAEFYAGVKWICNVTDDRCQDMSKVNCTYLGSPDEKCTDCQAAAGKTVLPVVLCVLAYAMYAHNTWLRYHHKDSVQAKTMCCFACFFAATNFLLVLLNYWRACIVTATLIHAEMGFGLLLMGVGGSLVKYICGFLHLFLPVGDSGSEEMESESESGSNGEVEVSD